VVTGAVSGVDRFNNPWLVIGTATEYTTIQDHAKLKLAYEITPTLRASYLFGYWKNDAEGRPVSYLRDAAGNTVYSGANLNLNGYRFTVNTADFSVTKDDLTHVTHGLSLKSNTLGTLDYEVAASLYDYARISRARRQPALAVLPEGRHH
jgi:iron complex outermembrane receptor protein